MKTLAELRGEIDAVDKRLRELFLKRMEISRNVASVKLEEALPVFRPEREAEILPRFLADADSYERSYLASCYQALLRASRAYQYRYQEEQGASCPVTQTIQNAPHALGAPRAVCFQGITGSWSSIAARRMYPEAERIACASFAGVFEAVRTERAQIGVVPIDNTTAGTVNDVHDLLVENDFAVNRAVSFPIRHCLLGLPGARREDIRVVFSHPQALSQCAEHIHALGAEARQETNTAVAARRIAQSGILHLGAIASPETAALYGLSILDDAFQDAPCNQTRFLSISRALTVPRDANRISLAFGAPNVAGSLAGVLSVFADNGLSLTKIMSRPMPEHPWEYIFYVDCEIKIDNPCLYAVLYQLSSELPWLKLLGCYREETLSGDSEQG